MSFTLVGIWLPQIISKETANNSAILYFLQQNYWQSDIKLCTYSVSYEYESTNFAYWVTRAVVPDDTAALGLVARKQISE